MKRQQGLRWISLIASVLIIAFSVSKSLLAQNEEARNVFMMMLVASVFPLLQLLDSFGWFGKRKEEYTFLDKKLTDIYSPIHAMIVAVDKDMSRAGQIIGGFMSATSIDVARLSTIFRDHGHDLGNHHLQMWLAIEKEIGESVSPIPIPGLGVHTMPGFSMNKERRMWFDDLEAEYQRLVKELEKLR